MLKGPGHAGSSRERQWPTVAGVCLGLLVLPLAGWLLLAPPPASPRAKAATRAGADAEPSREAARTARTPRSTQPAATAATTGIAPADGIEGEVVGPDGQPVSGAMVRCKHHDREIEASTDESGRFRFASDAAGCTVVATKRGFAPSAEAVLGAGVRLRLAPAAGIAGVVVAEDGAPVMTYFLGVESFEPAGSGAADGGGGVLPPSTTINDAEGAFALEDLLPGRYVLAASAPHHIVARTEPVEVRAGAVTKGVKIVLKHGRTVVGTVVDARTRKPIFGAMVFADTGPEAKVRSVPGLSLPPSGEFTLEETCGEVCNLRAWIPGYVEAEVRGLQVPASGSARVEIALTRLGDAPP